MSIARYKPVTLHGMYQSDDGQFVTYGEHLEVVEKLQSLKKYKPDQYSMYIINYYEIKDGGAYELVTQYVTYNHIEKFLNELTKKSSISQPNVYAISKIEVEREVKLTIKLPE